MLLGRLGLETARIPHIDRHGLVYLARGALTVRNGTLVFKRKETPANQTDSPMELGRYEIPFQMVSMVLVGPGSTVSHDALRLLGRHGTGLVAVGDNGVRCYTAPPLMSGRSTLARRQATVWADTSGGRLDVARRMFKLRFGVDELPPHESLDALRGMEGARAKRVYVNQALRYGIPWRGRRYDRANPSASDLPNQALNHASSAVEGAASIAVAATATIPQLGFLHEDPSQAFVLDVADLVRDQITIPAAFSATSRILKRHNRTRSRKEDSDIERTTRRLTGEMLQREKVISLMIDHIKTFFAS